MNPACLAVRPFERRPAYQPTDPIAYRALQELRCVRSDTADLGPEVRLCSLCTEVALGEPLLDDIGNATQHSIAFYQLPCGHLRCCSCALKWLDPAGIFHRVCHFCDSQQRSIDPDLSVVIGTFDCSVEPDMSWIKGFYDGKPRKPAAPDAQPKIELPPILEVNEIEATTLVSERPVKACPREQHRVPLPRGIEVAGQPVPPQLQWTPKAPRKEELLDYMRGAALEIPSSDEEQSYIMSAKGQKKHKHWTWPNTPKHEALPGQAFEDGLEEEEEDQQPRKKLRRSLYDKKGGR
ncbi:MAG: hypothetical protein Q9172_001214 [Xanthocarpia lactea]